MTTAGPNNPGTAINDTGVGTIAWSNPTNCYSDNGQYATAYCYGYVYTNYLKATNFGFNIPSNATINGIVVDIQRKATTSDSTINFVDNKVYIVKGGTIQTTQNKAAAEYWPNNDTYKTYGNSTDLWGLSWAHTDINNSGFGIAISATSNDEYEMGNTAYVDHIRITIYYTAPSSVQKTFTINTLIKKKNIPKTFTINSLIKKKNIPKTFTINTLAKLINSKIVTIDTLIKKENIPYQFTIDTAIKKIDIIKEFNIDTLVKQINTKEFSIDSFIKATNSKNFTIDTLIKAINSKNFTIDTYIVSASTKTKTFYVDTLIKQMNNKVFTVDTLIKIINSKNFTIDTISVNRITKDFDIDTLIKQTNYKTFSIDTLITYIYSPTIKIGVVAGGSTTLIVGHIDTFTHVSKIGAVVGGSVNVPIRVFTYTGIGGAIAGGELINQKNIEKNDSPIIKLLILQGMNR